MNNIADELRNKRKILMRRLKLFGLVVTVTLLATVCANARVKYSRSPVHTAWFMRCELWNNVPFCVPMSYRWQAFVTIEYDSYYDPSIGTNRVLIRKVDQSVQMYGVGQNPCGINLGARTNGYDRWGNYYWTIFATHPGQYIYSSTTRHWGGVAYPNWWIPGPKLTTVAEAVATDGCTGYASFSWNISLP